MNTESKRLNWSPSSGTDEHWSLGISAGITLALDALVRVSNKVGDIFSSFFYVLSVQSTYNCGKQLIGDYYATIGCSACQKATKEIHLG